MRGGPSCVEDGKTWLSKQHSGRSHDSLLLLARRELGKEGWEPRRGHGSGAVRELPCRWQRGSAPHAAAPPRARLSLGWSTWRAGLVPTALRPQPAAERAALFEAQRCDPLPVRKSRKCRRCGYDSVAYIPPVYFLCYVAFLKGKWSQNAFVQCRVYADSEDPDLQHCFRIGKLKNNRKGTLLLMPVWAVRQPLQLKGRGSVCVLPLQQILTWKPRN